MHIYKYIYIYIFAFGHWKSYCYEPERRINILNLLYHIVSHPFNHVSEADCQPSFPPQMFSLKLKKLVWKPFFDQQKCVIFGRENQGYHLGKMVKIPPVIGALQAAANLSLNWCMLSPM